MNTTIRTFDCPWCGAISTVPADHLGEHFHCPECRKPTKITERNTTAGGAAGTAADTTHLSGDRTFDCPWCGAISAVPSSHLGERFACPECHRDTKLTSTNTQRSPVTVPPPDAPHVESSRRGLWIGLGVAAAAFVGFLLLRDRGEPSGPQEPERSSAKVTEEPSGTRPADRPAAGTPPVMPSPGMTGEAPPMPATSMTEEAPPMPSPGMTGEAPPMPIPGMTEAPPPAPAEPPELLKARAQHAAAAAAFASATEKHARATLALETWAGEHPGAKEAHLGLPALEQVSAELVRLLSDPAVVADPANPKPAELRAVRAAMAKFVEASPERVAIAERALASMRQDLGGREVAGVADWRELPFAGDGYRRVISRLLESARAVAVPAELEMAHVSATKELEAARAALDSATAGLRALEEGPPR